MFYPYLEGPWKKIQKIPHHGICLFLSSLKTKNSCGIGEYLDLLPFLDWMKTIRFDLLQLLPINHTLFDPSPYSCSSKMALHPIYLSLHCYPFFKGKLHTLQKLGHERVDYLFIYQEKHQLLWQFFLAEFSKIQKEKTYQQFLSNNDWLKPWSLFSALQQHFSFKPCTAWPLSNEIADIKQKDSIIQQQHFACFLQYLCYQQLKRVSEKAKSLTIFLQADIPLLLSKNSCEWYFHPEWFLQDLRAGSPPDMYHAQGQDWGFPILDWKGQEKLSYPFWKECLQWFSQFFSLYRMDHVVGVFRIWTMQKKESILQGGFFPKNRYLWPFLGEKHLVDLLQLSSMLPIAEDLGTIPVEVRPILKKLGICKTSIIPWERYEEDQSFIPLTHYERLSLTSLSTHDSPTFRQWWQLYPQQAQNLAQTLGIVYQSWNEDLQFAILQKAHQSASYFHSHLFQEYLCMEKAYQKAHPSDERINIPGTTSTNNWSLRMIPFLEDVLQNPTFKAKMESFTQ